MYQYTIKGNEAKREYAKIRIMYKGKTLMIKDGFWDKEHKLATFILDKNFNFTEEEIQKLIKCQKENPAEIKTKIIKYYRNNKKNNIKISNRLSKTDKCSTELSEKLGI